MVTGTSGKAITLDATGDIVIEDITDGGTTPSVVEQAREVEQALRIRLSTRLGEDPISPTVGLPISEMIGIFNPDFIAAAIRRCVMQEPRVDSIGPISVTLPDENRATRRAEVSFSVKLKGGEEINLRRIFGV